MSRFLREHLSSWFLLLWLMFIYTYQVSLSRQGQSPLLILIPFTLLMLIHISMYWLRLFRIKGAVPGMAILAGLALSALGMILLANNCEQTTGIGLALVVEFLCFQKKTRLAGLVLIGCLIILDIIIRLFIGTLGINVMPLLLFGVGSIVLVAQQAYAREQTQAVLDELEAAHAKLEAAHEQLAAYAVQVEELTLTTERQRLARELHDTQSQGLAGLILQLEAVNAHLANQHYAKAREIVVQSMRRARATLNDARSVIDDLRAAHTSADDLAEAVREEIEQFTTTTGITCTDDLAALKFVPQQWSDYALRAVTEGLSNIARHAQASRAWISTVVDDGMVTIETGDNGSGFDSCTSTECQGHYGLLGLRERARLAGGRFEIISAPGTGTVLRLHLPRARQGALT